MQPPTPQEAELKLWTDIPSHAGQANTPEGALLKTALDQMPPPSYEKYNGGAPLLKSALQVCLCSGMHERTNDIATCIVLIETAI